MDAIGYVRVSTARQAEDGLGLVVQEKAIRRWCRENDHHLVAIHRDEATSGTLAERVALGAALASADAGEAQLLVVYRLDRLARDLILTETLIARLGLAGCEVVSIAEPAGDGDDHTRTLIRHVLGAIAQYERALIVARMQAGRAAKAAKGGFAYGSPPFGWQAVGRELVVDVDEQLVITRIRKLHDARCSLRDIARILEAEGIGAKHGGTWHTESLRRLIKRQEATTT